MTDNDNEDFRSRLRRRAETATAAPESDDSGDYRAWGKSHAESRMDWLDFRLIPSEPGVEEEGEAMALHLLTFVTYRHSKEWHDRVTLVFADRLVTLIGRNLGTFRRELMGGQVDYVQVFDRERWPKEPAADKPIVTHIVMEKPGEEEQPPPLRLVKNDQE